MSYTNSPLVSYTKLSPNHSGQRTHSIDRITPHCVVGQCSVETLGNIFLATPRQASSNYGIGVDGRVGMYVEEKNCSWCTSSRENDQRAITIECASDTTEPYTMNAKVYESLINLCTDICRRNGKSKLLWFADKTKTLNYEPKADEMVITVHRWFANKSCPGNWLYERLGDLAAKVTANLGTKPVEPADPKPTEPVPADTFKVGDKVKMTAGAPVYGKTYKFQSWVYDRELFVRAVSGSKITVSIYASGDITGNVDKKYLTLLTAAAEEPTLIYTVVKGDTLWGIASKYLGSGTRYPEIVQLNGLKTSVIYSGQKLKIPQK